MTNHTVTVPHNQFTISVRLQEALQLTKSGEDSLSTQLPSAVGYIIFDQDYKSKITWN